MQDVRVEGLVKRFGNVTAVAGLSFRVNPGELVSLLGPSGCGKTTTLNVIAGFERPDEGEVFVGDRLISSGSLGIRVPPHRRNLGMVFQSYALWPHYTVANNVGYGLRMRAVGRDEARRKVSAALRLVRLEGLGDRYPSQLSGGQQQRVAFARAVVYEPDVLLLDEPLSNLDAALREEMRLELKELQGKTGLTTLYVTHDQVEAMVISDRIIVLNHGRIEQVGTPRDIYERPANRFVAGFIGVSNFLEGEIVEARNGEGHLQVRVGPSLMRCVGHGLAKGQAVLLSIRPEDWEVSLDRPSESLPNLLEGLVEKVVYMGGWREVWVRAGGQAVRIQATRLPAVRVGSSLFHWVRPDAVKAIALDR